MIACSLATKK